MGYMIGFAFPVIQPPPPLPFEGKCGLAFLPSASSRDPPPPVGWGSARSVPAKTGSNTKGRASDSQGKRKSAMTATRVALIQKRPSFAFGLRFYLSLG